MPGSKIQKPINITPAPVHIKMNAKNKENSTSMYCLHLFISTADFAPALL